jgi:hypothetical protein
MVLRRRPAARSIERPRSTIVGTSAVRISRSMAEIARSIDDHSCRLVGVSTTLGHRQLLP